MNSGSAKASAQYSATMARIRSRSWSALSTLLQCLSIPCDGTVQTLFERELRIPVKIPATIKIPTARNRHREPVGCGVSLANEIRARLAHIVWMPPLQRHIFGIRQDRLVSIGLIRRSNHNRVDLWRPATCFQNVPRASHVGLESRNWIAIGYR